MKYTGLTTLARNGSLPIFIIQSGTARNNRWLETDPFFTLTSIKLIHSQRKTKAVIIGSKQIPFIQFDQFSRDGQLAEILGLKQIPLLVKYHNWDDHEIFGNKSLTCTVNLNAVGNLLSPIVQQLSLTGETSSNSLNQITN